MTMIHRSSSRPGQRGSAMLVTLIIVAALLAGGSVLVSMQLSSNRGADVTRTSTTSLYCAEAGLTAARSVVVANYIQWAAALAVSATGNHTEPTWLSSGIPSHDLDGDSVADFTVWIEDNDDEGAGTNDRATDSDLRIFVVSRCLKYPDSPKEVRELIELPTNGVYCYQAQQGGCGGNGNSN
jgi:hypothetical protein